MNTTESYLKLILKENPTYSLAYVNSRFILICMSNAYDELATGVDLEELVLDYYNRSGLKYRDRFLNEESKP